MTRASAPPVLLAVFAMVVGPAAVAQGLPLAPLTDRLPPLQFLADPEGDHALAPMAFDLPSPLSGTGESVEPGTKYGIEFVCPANLQQNLGCPQYVLDPEDIMSQPRLLIDPTDPELVAFNAMHGGKGLHVPGVSEPPSNRSRDDLLHQPHTTFTSITSGALFDDYRYYSRIKSEYDHVYGEDNSAALDGQGRIYLGSLYTFWDDGDACSPHYLITVWKLDRINRAPDYTQGWNKVETSGDCNLMDSVHMVHVPDLQKVAVLWRETYVSSTPNVPVPVGQGRSSWIGVAHTDADGRGTSWEKMADDAAIGPCRQISNAIASGGRIYVACLPGEGSDSGEAGVYNIHAIDLASGTTRHIAATPVSGQGNAVLAPRGGEGKMILASGGLDGAGQPFVTALFGKDGQNWSKMGDGDERGRKLSNLSERQEVNPDTSLVDARVNGLGFAPYSSNVHLIYWEKFAEAGVSTPTGLPAYAKRLGVVGPDGHLVGRVDLDVGNAASRLLWDSRYQGVGDGVFDDLHDDVVTTHDRDGKPRTFIAYGDYGWIRTAEVVEENPIPCCIIPGGSPPPIPAAAAATNPAEVAAVVGALAGALTLRMLAARKKHKMEAPSL